jgi:hypothetical protein
MSDAKPCQRITGSLDIATLALANEALQGRRAKYLGPNCETTRPLDDAIADVQEMLSENLTAPVPQSATAVSSPLAERDSRTGSPQELLALSTYAQESTVRHLRGFATRLRESLQSLDMVVTQLSFVLTSHTTLLEGLHQRDRPG